MRDQIVSQVPETAEQVRAIQILLTSADQAREVQVQHRMARILQP
jgi:hypothetical protein